MELFGLKDKDGKSYKVFIPKFAATDNSIRCEPEVEAEHPKFKVRDWVICPANFPECTRITTQEVVDIFNQSNLIELRLATPQEIEDHLRKICKEKGLMKNGGKLKSPMGGEFIFNELNSISYFNSSDALYSAGMALYFKGKFAEIIEEKKHLPKTKEELLKLLYFTCTEFERHGSFSTCDIILEDYEDE